MFNRVSTDEVEMIRILVDGEELIVRKGLNIAAALLEANIRQFRKSAVTGEARAPYCMMGVCFDCLLTIDGIPNQQSCLVEVSEGMRVDRQWS